jgi:hypothetical protein
VLLEQVENGLLCWRGHCWRARGCHESPPVRRSRRVPRAVGTAALMALLLRDENHHAVLVGLPSFEVSARSRASGIGCTPQAAP